MIGQAVETKAALYAKAAASTDVNKQERADVGKSFQVGVPELKFMLNILMPQSNVSSKRIPKGVEWRQR